MCGIITLSDSKGGVNGLNELANIQKVQMY
jgi:hypothetical protein